MVHFLFVYVGVNTEGTMTSTPVSAMAAHGMETEGIWSVESVPSGARAAVNMERNELQWQLAVIRELAENMQSWSPMIGYPLSWEDAVWLNATLIAIFTKKLRAA